MIEALDDLASGGAPCRDEPLAVEFLNTVYLRRGVQQEGVGTAEHLAAWLRDHAGRFTAPLPSGLLLKLRNVDARRFQSLRDAMHAVAESVVDKKPVSRDAVAELNHASALAPHWPILEIAGQGYVANQRTSATPVDAVLGELARAGVELFAEPMARGFRRCASPGCILYFYCGNGRREWCSTACGTRARVARHYQRHKNR